ncbi:MAG: rod shape-determining protein RodA [Gammaproteobacteria bacterium]|nr:rod shape-determining protein RodA [Gammaproteobacteria bacterium]
MRDTLNAYQRLHLDKPLFSGLVLLALCSLIVLYSAGGENMRLLAGQGMRLAFGFGIMLAIAQLQPETLSRWSPYIFGIGLGLLLIVLAIGVTSKGAQRWINLGLFRIQPSEIMKLGVPMMAAWFLSRNAMPPRPKHVLISLAIIVTPAIMVAKQPDLGTAIMIATAGLFVLFLAGMNWKWITSAILAAAGAVPLLWNFYMHDYQKKRVLTLFDPNADPLGTGYHTIQSMIAVGSGGLYGKGWGGGSQAQLDFIPERSTDFIFAVFAEEFGFLGILILFSVYLFVVIRGLQISFSAQDTFTRLLAGSLALTFFFYFFVNIGMVTGILPVVGVPLPIVSFGGSSIVTLMAGFGILMSIQTHRKIVQV